MDHYEQMLNSSLHLKQTRLLGDVVLVSNVEIFGSNINIGELEFISNTENDELVFISNVEDSDLISYMNMQKQYENMQAITE
ncbi:19752_t:CDS:2, partial [Dentiscutata erythropus]